MMRFEGVRRIGLASHDDDDRSTDRRSTTDDDAVGAGPLGTTPPRDDGGRAPRVGRGARTTRDDDEDGAEVGARADIRRCGVCDARVGRRHQRARRVEDFKPHDDAD